MSAPSFSQLQTKLRELNSQGPLKGLKSGTEIEDMNFEELAFLRKLSYSILPLSVKIGGAEARNDIRILAEIGVDCIIAPMIESPYALKKFIVSLHEVLPVPVYQKIAKAINIETECAVKNIEDILFLKEFSELSQVTAARTDLSGSMNLEVSNPKVTKACSMIVKKIQAKKISTSVGGKILPNSFIEIANKIQPDFVNTRHMLLSVRELLDLKGNPLEVIKENLLFECLLYEHLYSLFPSRRADYQKRIETILLRLESSPV